MKKLIFVLFALTSVSAFAECEEQAGVAALAVFQASTISNIQADHITGVGYGYSVKQLPNMDFSVSVTDRENTNTYQLEMTGTCRILSIRRTSGKM